MRARITCLRRATVAGLACAVAAGAPAVATAQVSVLDEIIVTAQRREEILQEVPVAVTAFSSEQLDILQVNQALDMGRLVPNFVAHNNTGLGTANSYSLRGLNNTESIATFDPPVGSYVDDIYVARQNANNFTLFDVERVEVLRGPQGTLFGRNTTGGAVRVILAKPAEVFGGYVEGGFGSYDRYTLRGSVDLPVSDRILTKWSAYWIDEEGYVDNLTTGEEIQGEENFGVRGAVLFNITDDLAWDLALDYEDTDEINLTNMKRGSARVSRTGLTTYGTPLANFFTNEKRNFNLGNEVQAFNVTSNIEWQTGLGELSFITGWRDLSQEYALDFLDGNAAARIAAGDAPPPWGGFTLANDGDHEQFTQEIKLAGQAGERVEYVAGFFYLDEDNTTDFADLLDLPLGGGNFIPLVLADRILDNETEAWAVYFQSDISLTDQLVFTAGVRYTDEEKTIAFTDNQPCPPTDGTCFVDSNNDGIADSDLTTENLILNGIPTKLNEKLWTPRFALQYTAHDDLNVYVSATRGFKSGGWNARGTSPAANLPFDSEVVWSYEAGLRSEWLDDRLRLNLTAFYTDVSEFQLPTAFQPPTGQPVFITRNFADLETRGIEMELIANPIERLTVVANVGLMDGEYRNLDPAIQAQRTLCLTQQIQCGEGIIEPDGGIADPTRIPEYTATLWVNYDFDLGNGLLLTPSASMYAVGDHSVFSTGTPEFLVDGYTTFTASLTLAQLDQDWRVELACRNCNDRTMLVSGLAGQPYYQDPRTWSLTFRKGFGG